MTLIVLTTFAPIERLSNQIVNPKEQKLIEESVRVKLCRVACRSIQVQKLNVKFRGTGLTVQNRKSKIGQKLSEI